MYFDSLTLTAIVIFIVGFLCVVRFCIFGLCGGPLQEDQLDDSMNH